MKVNAEIPESEYQLQTMRSSGPGGQHANKVETAVQLRFDIPSSTLAEDVKARLLSSADKRITAEGILILKSDQYRSQQKNKDAVIKRLHALVDKYLEEPKKRKKTKPSKAAKEERLARKAKRSNVKQLRKKVIPD